MKRALMLCLVLLSGCVKCELELDEWCGHDCRTFDETIDEAEAVDGNCNGRPFSVLACGEFKIIRVTGVQVTDSYFDASGALVGVTQTSDGVYDCEHGLIYGEVPNCTKGTEQAYCDRD